jgi:GTP-binding protein HflX
MTLTTAASKGVANPGGFLFDRPKLGERAILVQVGIGSRVPNEQIEEFQELARSAGAEVCATVTGTRRAPDARFFIGSGKADELRQQVELEKADLVLFNHELSPSQERNLEASLRCRVLDRAGLILDIFAQRARSFEGKLQVELAQLEHLSTRLVRGWTHLERQKGGIGLRGPGETQLETDRRLLGQRIRQLNRRLERVQQQREQGRRTRHKAEVPTVSLVGYTNAGKSTLFNRLTDSSVYAADKLFATLDPTLRRLDLGEGRSVVLADTVGFVRDLPHELVAAFRSTLQETRDASLLLHVVDAADAHRMERIAQVNEVLAEIGAAQVRQIEVFNKIDLLNEQPRVLRDEQGNVTRVWLSSSTGAGLQALIEAIRGAFDSDQIRGRLHLGVAEARTRARLHELDAVVEESVSADHGWDLLISLPERDFLSMCRHEGLAPERLLRAPCAASDTFLQSRTVA